MWYSFDHFYQYFLLQNVIKFSNNYIDYIIYIYQYIIYSLYILICFIYLWTVNPLSYFDSL